MATAHAQLSPLSEMRVKEYPRRYPWRWVAAIVILALVGWVIWTLAGADIVWAHVLPYVGMDVFVQAAINTLVLAVASQALAIAIGVVMAILRISHNPVARTVSIVYIWLFRGLPVLVQLLLWYNLALVFTSIKLGVPFTDVVFFSAPTNAVMTPFVAGLLGLSLNESAYMAEIIRAGINGIDKGQTEAAHSLGMSPMSTITRIVLPQAMRIIIPPTGNDFINMIKTTSMASVITYVELVRAANMVASRNLEVMETLFAAAIWYMILVSLASIGQYYLERMFTQSRGPGLFASVWRSVVRPPMARVKMERIQADV